MFGFGVPSTRCMPMRMSPRVALPLDPKKAPSSQSLPPTVMRWKVIPETSVV